MKSRHVNAIVVALFFVSFSLGVAPSAKADDDAKVRIKIWPTTRGELKLVQCHIGYATGQPDAYNIHQNALAGKFAFVGDYKNETEQQKQERLALTARNLPYNPKGYDTLVITLPDRQVKVLKGWREPGYDDHHEVTDQSTFRGYIGDIFETKDHKVYIVTDFACVYEFTPNEKTLVRQVSVQGYKEYGKDAGYYTHGGGAVTDTPVELCITKKAAEGIYVAMQRNFLGATKHQVGYLKYDQTTNTWTVVQEIAQEKASRAYTTGRRTTRRR